MKALDPFLLKEASAVFARAFFRDPLYEWLFPSIKDRFQKICALYRLILSLNICYAWVFSELLEGIAIWIPPYEHRMELSLTSLVAVVKFLWCIGIVSLVRLLFFTFAIFPIRKRCIPEDAFFLLAIVVDPPCQKKGVGKTMLQELFSWAEKLKLPICLETQNPINVTYYRRFGFGVVEHTKIAGLEYIIMKKE